MFNIIKRNKKTLIIVSCLVTIACFLICQFASNASDSDLAQIKGGACLWTILDLTDCDSITCVWQEVHGRVKINQMRGRLYGGITLVESYSDECYQRIDFGVSPSCIYGDTIYGVFWRIEF